MFRNTATLASVVAVAGVLAASSLQAASSQLRLTMTNNLTFSNAVALPGVTLMAGTYVFEAGPEGTNPNIVRVLSQNRQKVFYMGFTVPKTRRYDAQASIVTFGEAPQGSPTPILAWYPAGASSGHEFMYR
jgi:hypothetical protein